MEHRIKLRGFDQSRIEEILRYTDERYFDTATQRMIAIGKHDKRLVLIPYEQNDDTIVPVTIHATTRQQIKFRVQNGRFIK